MNNTYLSKIGALKHLLQAELNLELAILVGSRVTDTATQNSDWNIAIRWKKGMSGLEYLQYSAVLKKKIANAVDIHQEKIDLIDMSTARLAMKAVVAEEGLVLKNDGTLAWSHFLTQTWAELKDHYWRKQHAA